MVARKRSSIPTRFISHGTLGCRDLEKTRVFYEEFLGLKVVRTSHISMMVQLGSAHVYAVVQIKNKDKMHRCYHNGLDVLTDQEVDESYQLCCEQAEKWSIKDITKPIERHGTYSFHFWDLDDNAWEILSNPKGGYTWIFEQGDLVGKGHFSQGFRENRPDTKDH
jgi:predicted lactoylglutathione lyase